MKTMKTASRTGTLGARMGRDNLANSGQLFNVRRLNERRTSMVFDGSYRIGAHSEYISEVL